MMRRNDSHECLWRTLIFTIKCYGSTCNSVTFEHNQDIFILYICLMCTSVCCKSLFHFEAKVRSVKANAYDSAYASALSEHAVHGALAGLTCVSVVQCLVSSWQWRMVGYWMGRVKVFQLFAIAISTRCPFPLTCSHLDKVRMYSKTVYIPIHAC